MVAELGLYLGPMLQWPKEIQHFNQMHEIELTHRYPRQFVPISRSSRPLWIPMKGLRWGWAAQGLLLPFRPSSSSVIDWLIDIFERKERKKMTLMRSHIIQRTNAKKAAEFPWYLNEANQTSSLKCKYKYRLVAPLFFAQCKIQQLLFNLRFHNSAEIHTRTKRTNNPIQEDTHSVSGVCRSREPRPIVKKTLASSAWGRRERASAAFFGSVFWSLGEYRVYSHL